MSREITLCAQLLEGFTGVMYDVGAMRGGSHHRFIDNGWQVHAFEPDPAHATEISRRGFITGNMFLNEVAVMDYCSLAQPFYASPESPGIGTLTPWLDSHSLAAHVEVISLGIYILDKGHLPPDFLKVDAEGNDLHVLRGYPWWEHQPRLVMCEYDHRKEGNFIKLVDLLEKQGYSLIVSEYEPVIEYGKPHEWIGYRGEKSAPRIDLGWGNIIGIK